MIEIVLAFATGAVTAWWLRRPRRAPERSAMPLRRGSVIGVYSTVHTDAGDLTTSVVESVTIDCERFVFELAVPEVPFDCTLLSTTFHLGLVNVPLGISQGKVRRGQHLTVVQQVEMSVLFPAGPVPA